MSASRAPALERPFYEEWWERTHLRMPAIYAPYDYLFDGLVKANTSLYVVAVGNMQHFVSQSISMTPAQKEFAEIGLAWRKVAYASMCAPGIEEICACAYKDNREVESTHVVQNGPLLKRKREAVVKRLGDDTFRKMIRDRDLLRQCQELYTHKFFDDSARCRKMMSILRREPSLSVPINSLTHRAQPRMLTLMWLGKKRLWARCLHKVVQQHRDALVAGQVDGWLTKKGLFWMCWAKPKKGLEHYAAAPFA